MRNRKCHYCREKIVGRPDKKFCDRYCRSAFHNEKIKEDNHLVRTINRLLKRNRSILKEILEQGIQRIPRNILAAKGFTFEYYTMVLDDHPERKQYYCYEVGYVEEPEGMYAIYEKSNQRYSS